MCALLSKIKILQKLYNNFNTFESNSRHRQKTSIKFQGNLVPTHCTSISRTWSHSDMTNIFIQIYNMHFHSSHSACLQITLNSFIHFSFIYYLLSILFLFISLIIIVIQNSLDVVVFDLILNEFTFHTQTQYFFLMAN